MKRERENEIFRLKETGNGNKKEKREKKEDQLWLLSKKKSCPLGDNVQNLLYYFVAASLSQS